MQTQGTLIGFIAVLLWGCLAFLTDLNRAIPPFQLMAMSFAAGFLVIFAKWQFSGQSARRLARQSLGVWGLTLFGLFGYHFCYFLALRHAPVAQAGLIAYLWPLLIVLLANRLLNAPVTKGLVVGVLLSLLGCAMLIYQPDEAVSGEYWTGYLLAFACALIWSSYSVLSAKMARLSDSPVPSDFVGWGCAVTAVLALLCHVVLEQTLWPLSGEQWLGVILLGAGPVGMAFVAWDHGMKRGNVALLGSLSYLAPLLSTLILVIWAGVALTGALMLGTLLILSGAVLAGRAQNN